MRYTRPVNGQQAITYHDLLNAIPVPAFIVDRDVLKIVDLTVWNMFKNHQGLFHGLDDHYEQRIYPHG